MICQEIKGNYFDSAGNRDNEELYGFEIVALTWDECSKRILRKTTDLGREIGISLPQQTTIRHGDILVQDDEHTVLVFVQPCQVLVVFPDSVQQLGLLAYELGNRHLPLQVTDKGEIVLLPDDPTESLLLKLNARFERQNLRFQPIPKSGHSHSSGQGHRHNHAHQHEHQAEHEQPHGHFTHSPEQEQSRSSERAV